MSIAPIKHVARREPLPVRPPEVTVDGAIKGDQDAFDWNINPSWFELVKEANAQLGRLGTITSLLLTVYSITLTQEPMRNVAQRAVTSIATAFAPASSSAQLAPVQPDAFWVPILLVISGFNLFNSLLSTVGALSNALPRELTTEAERRVFVRRRQTSVDDVTSALLNASYMYFASWALILLGAAFNRPDTTAVALSSVLIVILWLAGGLWTLAGIKNSLPWTAVGRWLRSLRVRSFPKRPSSTRRIGA